MKLGRLILRLVVGGYFFGHGTQKLFGWFGGHGPEGTGQFFESLGLRPGKRHAMAAGAAEAGGGALLVLGAATPLAASVLTATMITAINRVHLKNGPWVTNQGYEYNLVLIAATLALAETGPGSPSIDTARDSNMYGPKWAFLALLLGALGAAGAHFAAESAPAPAPAETAPAPAPDTAAAAA
ncbi:MAG TPA: DoxX family protein [Solirubrobacteraceae bacterium]|nr:DoxX family protein [Solirubrobacteraceae bacterium]